MTEKTLAELRAETDRLMRQSLHKTMWPELWHKARMAALAVERNAADAEIERLTREIERLTRERDEAKYQLARSYQSEKCTLDPQTCKEAECFACGVLMCPHAEPMHLHHDGCPACHGAALAKARDGFELEVRDE